MDGSLMMEPELTQAVRIVLKYEIQSLLSRLSETGEEYIVLTASSDEGTCGHFGSTKGEGFVQASSLQMVKQEFLNFCTGTVKLDKLLTKGNSMQAAVTPTQKPNRRKSTPRCKFQNSSARNPSYAYTDTKEVIQGKRDTLESALDLTDKNGTYSYTLDGRDESRFSTSISQSSPYDYKLDTYDESSHISQSEIHPYTWQEEKLCITSQDIPSSSQVVNTNNAADVKKSESTLEQILKSKGLGIDKIPYMNESIAAEGMNPSDGKLEPNGKNRRKSRKAPVKRERKNTKGLTSGSVLNTDLAVMESEDSFIHEDSMSNTDSFKNEDSVFSGTQASEKVDENSYDSMLSNHVKSAVAANIKKSAKRQNLQNITDMKSAFEEIGNMAKCLICNKVLANKNNRTFHWRSHVGDKRYRCDICNKAFTHPSNMRSHRKIHTDEKPFPCDLCDRRFRRRDYLLQHLERFHYNLKLSADKALHESESNSS